jgi:hypothetical protein
VISLATNAKQESNNIDYTFASFLDALIDSRNELIFHNLTVSVPVLAILLRASTKKELNDTSAQRSKVVDKVTLTSRNRVHSGGSAR